MKTRQWVRTDLPDYGWQFCTTQMGWYNYGQRRYAWSTHQATLRPDGWVDWKTSCLLEVVLITGSYPPRTRA